MRILIPLVAVIAVACFAQTQSPDPSFEFADVHPSAIKANNQFRNGPVMRGGRYELKTSTMVDLVSLAWRVDTEKVLGGPSWLELDRFDIVAKAPPDSTADGLRPALQKLLAERFALKAHTESKPLPTFALTVGKKPLLKESDGSGEHGCKPAGGNGNPGRGGGMIMTGNADGTVTQIALGPGGTIQYACRNLTMKEFAADLGEMFTGDIGQNPIVDRTGLTARYNFDVRWSISFRGGIGLANDDRVSIFDAMDKQLGLKLEAVEVPTPVVVVDSVNRTPTANLPDIAGRLNIPPLPTEFDVVALKPFDQEQAMNRMLVQRVQPGGRVTLEGMSLQQMILNAWNLTPEMLVNAPSWLNSDRYDLIGRVSSPEQVEMEDVWPLVRKLLEDRFALKAHMEDRQVDAWRLVANKPKMKKADPNTRTHMENGVPPGAKDPRQSNPTLTRYVGFQNTTMALFAERLQRTAGGYIRTPIADETGLEGGWDFTLFFSPAGQVGGRGGRGGMAPARMSAGGAGGAGADASGDAAEPNGAISLFEAIDRQLGLKLEPQKRSLPVLVIDSIERKPKDN